MAESKRMLRVGEVSFAPEDIDHAHRIGMEYTEKVKSIIMKFKSWSARKQFYDARRRCYLLLREARELIKNNDDIDFAFANINCSLGFRYKNGSFRYFCSENELHNLINK